MSEEREPLFYVVAGKKGIGKTYLTKQLIKTYVQGVPEQGLVPRKVLIMDVNNEFSEFKTINPRDIRKFTVHPKVEVRRIPAVKPNGDPMSLDEIAAVAFQALKDFRGGMFVMEDITKYVSDTPSKDFIGTLATNRHVNTDIIAHFQYVGKAGHPKIKGTMNILRLHKTLDTISRHRNKFEEYSEILLIAEGLVAASYERGTKLIRELKRQKLSPESFKSQKEVIMNKFCRAYVYVDFDEENIKGNFTPEEFALAIEAYIMQYPEDTTNKYIKRKDSQTGRSLYNFKTALDACKSELFEKYYGNG